ncbi:MAG: hypothetical protein AB1810_01910 [Pseudomonadota bacterium]
MRTIGKLILGLTAGLALSAAHAGMEVKWRDVKDPYLGQALFHLYQDQNLTGIIKLSAAREMGLIKSQQDEAELARAMLNLTYGLHRETANSMVTMENKGNINKDIANVIWFYIAKIRYQRGYFTQAESALTNISGALPYELEQDLKSFMALLLMDRKQYRPAVGVLSKITGKTTPVPYSRYNIGINYLLQRKEGVDATNKAAADEAKTAAELEDRALKYLDAVARYVPRNEEEKALRDRANTNLGYIHLIDKHDADLAIEYFERVRLNSSESNDALLGLGWAFYNKGDYNRALVAWNELAGRNVADTFVQEARVAVPYTLAKLEAYQEAGEKYALAMDSFKQELKAIERTIESVKKGAYFDKLLTNLSGGEKGWMGDVYSLPKTTESYYFTQMLAQHNYQESLKNYRDLRYLLDKLDVWEKNLEAFEDTARHWENRLKTRARQFDEQAFNGRIKQMRAEHEKNIAVFTEINRIGDAMALATPQEQNRLARILQLKAANETGNLNPVKTEHYRRHLNMLERRVLWDIHSQFNSRQRKLKAAITETEQSITDAVGQKNKLQKVVEQGLTDSKARLARVAQTRAKIKTLRAQLEQEVATTERYMVNIALKDLEARKTLLSNFIAQVSFSVGAFFDMGGKE